jgi:tRNA(Ile)-lysidine synthase
MSNLIKKIQNTIFREGLFGRGARIVVAVSGGPDSVCMLDILAKLEPKYDLELIIAHVNYGLRGEDSERDEELVIKLAEKYALVYKVYKVYKVEKISENELRNIRYEFFEKIRKENEFDFIAVAHNADDQVETFLMRLIRGAGLQGLSAMQCRNDKVIRPLLGSTRAEILEHLKENDLKWRLDKTNLENEFLRNKIRNKLIPILEKEYNPNLKKTILDSIENIAYDYDFISKLSEKTSQKFSGNVSVKKLLALHPAMQRRVLRQMISQKKEDLKEIDASHISEIIKMMKSTKSKAHFVILKGLKISRKGDKLDIVKIK